MTSATADFVAEAKATEKGKAAEARGAAKTRVQFDLSPRAMKLLMELKDKTDAASYGEVVKNALKL
jgi:hypothetical protein